MTIYVVSASTGEYSDRSEWLVAAYRSEEDAKRHVTEATKYADAWLALSHTDEIIDLDWNEQKAREKTANPLDPDFSCDYTGTRYWYSAIELKGRFTVPEAIQ